MLKRFLKHVFVVLNIVPAIYSMEPGIYPCDVSSYHEFTEEKSSSIYPNPDMDYTPFVVRNLYDRQRAELSNSIIYFFITAYKQERFASNLARSLRLNYDRLREFGVDFRIKLTCDGRDEDREAFVSELQEAFEEIIKSGKLPFDVTYNEQNKGCSFTRYEQLLSSKEEIMRDIDSSKHVYFSIFDGDDMIHQDYCLLMLATALETDADIVGVPGLLVQCEESSGDIHKLQTQDICSRTLYYKEESVEDSTVYLFRASCIYNDTFDFRFIDHVTKEGIIVFSNPYTDFTVLDFLTSRDNLSFALFKKQYSIHDPLLSSVNPYDDLLNTVNITDIPTTFIPMFFYMQHSDSMEKTFLDNLMQACENRDMLTSILFAEAETRLATPYKITDVAMLLGIPDFINGNRGMIRIFQEDFTEEYLMEVFKNNHILAKKIHDILICSGFASNETVQFILTNSRMKILLKLN